MDAAAFDLDAYLERIGYAGPRAPTIDTLRSLQERHSQAIAFENLDPLLRRPVRLDTASLQEKLVRDGRGGWCFEQNQLFALALGALGFPVTRLAARVLWNAPAGTVTGRTHMVLRVGAEGAWVADVGFGGQTLTGPIRLESGIEQATPHEPARLLESGGFYTMQSKIDCEWKPLYRFDLTEQLAIDYEIANWYLCTFPTSYFLSNLVAARTEPGVRYALRNNEVAVHRTGQASERRRLESAAAIRSVLETDFRLRLPDSPELEPALTRIAELRPPD